MIGLPSLGREHDLVAIVALDGFRAGRFGLRVQLLPVERGVEGAFTKRVGPFDALLDAGALESRVLPRHLAIAAGCDFSDAGQFGNAEVFVGCGLVDGERAFQSLLREIDGGVLYLAVARFPGGLSAGGGDEMVDRRSRRWAALRRRRRGAEGAGSCQRRASMLSLFMDSPPAAHLLYRSGAG